MTQNDVRRTGPGPLAVVGCALLAGIVALALAPLGMTALYALVGLLAVGAGGYALRSDLREPLTAAVRRVFPARTRPEPFAPQSRSASAVHVSRSDVIRRRLVVTGLAVACAAVAWAVATQGGKAIAGLVAVVVLACLAVMTWPLVVDLARGGESSGRRPPSAASSGAPTAVAEPQGSSGRPGRRSSASFLPSLLVAAAGAAVAWVLAGLGIKGLLAALGALVVVGLLMFTRDRTTLFTFLAVCSFTFVLHKSLGPQDLTMSGGAISVYVTTLDAFLLVLYALWAREGTLVKDLQDVARHPLTWLPLVALATMLPSLLVAPSEGHALSELVRMAWMYLLYLYVAVRVRTRRHVWAVLGGLVVFAGLETIVVVLQWRTGGVLGLSFLGVPTSLGERTTDSEAIGRPFGTIIHPVFMAAALGVVAMLALAFAVERRRSLVRLTAALVAAAGLGCMWIAQSRASFVAAVMVGLVLVVRGVARGRISWKAIRGAAIAVAAVGAIFYPQISAKLSDNFGTGHFWEEIQSRLELNDVAGRMIHDHLLLGVGLNNFELVLPRYSEQPLIFFGNPVHNLYLLYFSETGIVGLIGFVGLGVVLYDVAIRLARSKDALFGPVGLGVAAAMGFLMVEELLGFSLRQDIPLALYWLFAGLAVACTRMAGLAWPGPWRISDWLKTGRGAFAGKPPTTEPGPTQRPPEREPVSVARSSARSSERPNVWEGLVRRWAARPTVSIRPLTDRIVRALARVRHLPTPRHPRRLGAAVAAAGLVAIACAVTPTGATAVATPSAPAATRQLVFTAVTRATGVQGIFTANLDGSQIKRISPTDGRSYDWPRWAFGNTKIIFTTRDGPPGSPEDIGLMNPDGSGIQILQHFEYRVAQPIVDPTGRFVVYTAQTPWFREVGLYRLDLATGLSSNLTGVTLPTGGYDSDPFLTPAGDQIVYMWTQANGRAAVSQMATDGSGRQALTDHVYFDSDPAVSPDSSRIAVASYRGTGTPRSTGQQDYTDVKLQDWHIVTFPRGGGPETILTEGQACATRTPINPCSPAQMSGVLPRYTPDGQAVSFLGASDSSHVCLCSISVDGQTGRQIINSDAYAIDWYDWPQPDGLQTSTAAINANLSQSRLLAVTSQIDGSKSLVGATADLMHRTDIPLPSGLQPLEARWGPGRSTIVFTALVPVGAAGAPHPAAPPGQTRRAHVTFDDIDPVATNQRAAALAKEPSDVAQHQVFLRNADGSVRQLTDPWIEDWRDGLAPNDARGNSNPVMTPDGRAVIVTNTSTLTGESFLLRIDLATGAVTNLTNATAGAIPTDDADPAVSPDGSQVAFAWTEGDQRGLHVMAAADGNSVRTLVDSPATTGSAAWAPDGRSLAWVSDGTSVRVGTLNDGEVTTGRDVSRGAANVSRPVFAPEGGQLAFIARAGNTLGLYVAPMSSGAGPRVLQPDPIHNFLFVDWR